MKKGSMCNLRNTQKYPELYYLTRQQISYQVEKFHQNNVGVKLRE
jgi:hypothetical protein